MIQSLPLPKVIMATTLLFAGILLVSCGSYQEASYYDNDGIYAEGTQQVYTKKKQQPTQQQGDGIYGDYFGQKADQIDEFMEDEVFTDVDDYYGGDVVNDSLAVVPEGNYYQGYNDYEGYAGWGDNPSNVTINNYNGAGWGWGGVGIGIGFGWGSGGVTGAILVGAGAAGVFLGLGLGCRLGLGLSRLWLGLSRLWLGLSRLWLGLSLLWLWKIFIQQ